MGGKPSRPVLSTGSQPEGSRGPGPGTPSTGASATAAAAAASAQAAQIPAPSPSTSPVTPSPASQSAWAGPDPFSQLASIKVQLIMQHLDARSRLFFARCSRSLQRDAQAPFAWEHCIINVPAMRALQDPHFLDQLRSSRFRSLPTRLCWNAHPPSPSAKPPVLLQSPTLQPSPVSDSRGSMPPSAGVTCEEPMPPPLMDVLLTVAALLPRPVAIEATGTMIDWPTLLRQPNMRSITALSIKRFDVLKLCTLEVLRALPRLHHLELRLANPSSCTLRLLICRC